MESNNIKEVEAEIRRHIDELTALRVHRNSLVPINYLPPEILSTIFILLRNSAGDFRTPDTWRPIREVCHSWRVLADATPLLWNRIYLRTGMQESRIAEMLDKSRSVDLTVEVRIPMSKSKGFAESVQLVAHHAQRIASLRFWVPQWGSQPFAERIFADLTRVADTKAEYSALRSLFVWGQYDQWAPRFDDVQHMLVPTMRYLYLGLKRIPGAADVYAALRSMPALNVLELHIKPRGSEEEGPVSPPSEPKIALEHLREIFLHGPPVTCAAILDSLVFPATAKLSVRCPDPHYFDSDQDIRYVSLLRALMAKIEPSTSSTSRRRHCSLYVRKSGRRACVIIDSWAQPQSIETLKDEPLCPNVHVVLPQSIGPTFVDALGAGLEDVQSLYLQDARYSDAWGHCVQKMVNLRDLIVAGETCSALPRILGVDERWGTMGKPQLRGLMRSHPTLPQLRSLVLLSPHFSSSSRWAMDEETVRWDLPLFKKVLSLRMDVKLGPTTVTVAARDVGEARSALDDAGLIKALGSRLNFEEHFQDGDEEIDDFEWDHYYDDEVVGQLSESDSSSPGGYTYDGYHDDDDADWTEDYDTDEDDFHA